MGIVAEGKGQAQSDAEDGAGLGEEGQEQVCGHPQDAAGQAASHGLLFVGKEHREPSFQRSSASLIFFTYRRET